MSYRIHHRGPASALTVDVLADKVAAAKQRAQASEFTLIDGAADYVHSLVATLDPRATVDLALSGHLATSGGLTCTVVLRTTVPDDVAAENVARARPERWQPRAPVEPTGGASAATPTAPAGAPAATG